MYNDSNRNVKFVPQIMNGEKREFKYQMEESVGEMFGRVSEFVQNESRTTIIRENGFNHSEMPNNKQSSQNFMAEPSNSDIPIKQELEDTDEYAEEMDSNCYFEDQTRTYGNIADNVAKIEDTGENIGMELIGRKKEEIRTKEEQQECGPRNGSIEARKEIQFSPIRIGNIAKCNWPGCGYETKIAQNWYMQRHWRTHTGERPITCKECSQKFRETWALKKHAKVHSGERPYKCAECGQAFKKWGELHRHQWEHTTTTVS